VFGIAFIEIGEVVFAGSVVLSQAVFVVVLIVVGFVDGGVELEELCTLEAVTFGGFVVWTKSTEGGRVVSVETVGDRTELSESFEFEFEFGGMFDFAAAIDGSIFAIFECRLGISFTITT
jgi:hypothetical protein